MGLGDVAAINPFIKLCAKAILAQCLAAAGIGGFRKMLNYAEKAAPLRRTVTIEEVGNTAAFLCSDLASGITGETTFVDAGVNIMGMVFDEDA